MASHGMLQMNIGLLRMHTVIINIYDIIIFTYNINSTNGTLMRFTQLKSPCQVIVNLRSRWILTKSPGSLSNSTVLCGHSERRWQDYVLVQLVLFDVSHNPVSGVDIGQNKRLRLLFLNGLYPPLILYVTFKPILVTGPPRWRVAATPLRCSLLNALYPFYLLPMYSYGSPLSIDIKINTNHLRMTSLWRHNVNMTTKIGTYSERGLRIGQKCFCWKNNIVETCNF